MKKWIWIIGIVLASMVWLFFYQTNTKSVAIAQEDDWEPKERGKANSIADLPQVCQDKYNAWATWMQSIRGSSNPWPISLEKRASTNGTTFEIELALEFKNMYNNNEATANCDE